MLHERKFVQTPFLSGKKSNTEFLCFREENLVRLSFTEKRKLIQKQVLLRELIIRHYYATEYNDIENLKERVRRANFCVKRAPRIYIGWLL